MTSQLDLIKENESLKTEIQKLKAKEEARQQFFTAFAKAQGAFKVNSKNQEVTVCSQKDGKWTKYTYKYLTLSELTEIIRKPFADNGISFEQGLNIEYKSEKMAFVTVTTIFRHSGGYESEPKHLSLPAYLDGKAKDIQTIGGVITYTKRYALQSLVGISADEDDDGNEACGNTIEPKQQPPKQQTFNCCKCGKIIDKRLADYSKQALGDYYCAECGKVEKNARETKTKEDGVQKKIV